MLEILDKVRYGVAVLTAASLPPAVLYWFVVHPFSKLWRGLGARKALVIIFTLFGLTCVGLFFVRDAILMVDYGRPSRAAVSVGGVMVVLGSVFQYFISRRLTRAILVGVPELSEDSPGKLLTEGVYAYTRNPRYLNIFFAVFAYGLLLNYLGIWVLWLLCIPAIYLIILLEERELRERFGDEYLEYCRRVPRLIPRRPHATG